VGLDQDGHGNLVGPRHGHMDWVRLRNLHGNRVGHSHLNRYFHRIRYGLFHCHGDRTIYGDVVRLADDDWHRAINRYWDRDFDGVRGGFVDSHRDGLRDRVGHCFSDDVGWDVVVLAADDGTVA